MDLREEIALINEAQKTLCELVRKCKIVDLYEDENGDDVSNYGVYCKCANLLEEVKDYLQR